jgi:hypothetical protein
VLLGMSFRSCRLTSTGLLPSMADTFQNASTSTTISDSSMRRQPHQNDPTTPCTQRLPAVTRTWFSLFRFRSPLLTESLLFSLPAGTEMFHFPAFPPTPYVFRRR